MDFSISNGMLFAFAAMICWGFGDFLIQRSTRNIGNWNTLFFITFFGTIVLTPFVYKDIITLFQLSSYHTWIIIISAVAILFAALFDFEALKHGKLSIIEPILALEVPITAAFSMIIANEFLGTTEIILIIIIMIGIILVSSTFEKIKSKVVLEKGVILGLLGALLMGASNFFIGYGSRITNPLLINWAIDLFMMIVCLIYIFSTRDLKSITSKIKKHPKTIIGVSIIDNAAWIFYAYAAALAPIAIVTAVSESYIALAVILGIIVNKESLMTHQKFGLALAVVGAIVLALYV